MAAGTTVGSLAAWDTQRLPALNGSTASGPTLAVRPGVVVPLRTMGVATSTTPVLLLDDVRVAEVLFRVESVSDGRLTTSPRVRVQNGEARWTVTGGTFVPRQEYGVSVIDADPRGATLLEPRNLLVDLQRPGEQQLWSFSGVNVAQVTGEPVVTWASPGLSTLQGTAGFTLIHRPTNPAQAGVPPGWALIPTGVGSPWSSLHVTRNGAVARLTAWDGWSVTFERANRGAFVPLLGPHGDWPGGRYATLSASPDGGWSVTDVNESVTTFPAADVSRPVTVAPASTWTDGSPTLQQTWVKGRLAHVTDPVSGRRLRFSYAPSPDCAAPADGFVAAPEGMLCAEKGWDGERILLSYVLTDAGPQIARITAHADAGESAQVTDLGWDRSGRISSVRQPLAGAAVAAGSVSGLAAQDARAQTTVTYDGNGRVRTIEAPAGLVTGAVQTDDQRTRVMQTLAYTTPPGQAVFTVAQSGTTTPFVHQSAADPATMNQVRSTDNAGRSTLFTYDADDQATEVFDVTSRTRSRTVYDAQGLAVTTIGPSRRAMTTTSGAPVVRTRYDTYDSDPGPRRQMRPIEGLVLFSYDNKRLSGSPSERSVGPRVGGRTPVDMAFTIPRNPSGRSGAWSGRMSGRYVAGRSGTHQFRSRNGVRLWVNGQACTVQTPCTAELADGAGADLQAELTSDSDGRVTVDFQVAGPDGRWQALPTSALRPGLQRITEREVSDQLSAGRGSTRLLQTEEYDDATGSGNLLKTTSPSGAEVHQTWAPNTGADNNWGQHTSMTDASGHTTTYSYFGGTEKAATCNGTFPQGGMSSGSIRPGGIRSFEAYGVGGATALARSEGTRTCLRYDRTGGLLRGVVSGDGEPYSVTRDHLKGGNPLRSSLTTTSQGETTTVTNSVSITGRLFQTTDRLGTVTTYDYDPATNLPRKISVRTRSGQVRTTSFEHDRFGQLTSTTVNGTVLQTTSYRSDGTPQLTRYANGSSSATVLDDNNNIRQVTYAGFDGGVTMSDAATYSSENAVLTRTLRGPDGTSTVSATYDMDHRLVAAQHGGTIPLTTRSTTLDFSGPSGANGNRQSQTSVASDGAATTSTFAYDDANRLTATTMPGLSGTIAYDDHGRTTAIGATALSYDAGGRLTDAVGPRGTIAFTGDGTVAYTPVTGPTVTIRPSGNLLLDESGQIVGQMLSLTGGVTVALDAAGAPTAWQYSDLQGSAAWSTTGSAAPTATTVYDPWGSRISTEAAANPDTPLGLAMAMQGWAGSTRLPVGDDAYVIGVRQYSPAVGRFLQRDPRQGGSLNPYEYGSGDPLNSKDHNGELSVGRWVGLSLTVILGAIVAVATAGAAAPAAAATIGSTVKAVAVGAALGAAQSAVINTIEQSIDYGISNFKLDSFGIAVGFGAAAGGVMAGGKHLYAGWSVAPVDALSMDPSLDFSFGMDYVDNNFADLVWTPDELALFGVEPLVSAGTSMSLGQGFTLAAKSVPLSLAKWGVGYTVKTAMAGGFSTPTPPSTGGAMPKIDAGSAGAELVANASMG